ncbi:hypothetical protein DRJ17_02915 [Candidatus Woesearchaeota archaeon]|nr:MAG: hypothetical protein DRJ17_02915 [Candidatus Woesearchaeota archaeon]
MGLTEQLGKAFTPTFLRPGMRKYFLKAGKAEIPYKTFGVLFYVSFVLTLLIYVLAVYPALTTHTLVVVDDSVDATLFATKELVVTGVLENKRGFTVENALITVNVYNRGRGNTEILAGTYKDRIRVDIPAKGTKSFEVSFEDVEWDRYKIDVGAINPDYRVSGLEVLRLLVFTFVSWVFVQLVIALFFMLLIYYGYDVKIYNRTKKIEKVLPDFLQFVGENLRAGMSFDQALWKAVRPEFDVLAAEIRIASKKVATGASVEKALTEFTEKYKSPTLRRSFVLITEGIRGGGRMSDIIDGVVENLRDTSNLREEIRTTSMNYVFFVSFIVMLVAPFLFAMAYQLLRLITGFTKTLGTTMTTTSFIQVSTEPAIQLPDFVNFSRLSIVIITFFATMIVSIIRSGNIRSGVKYIPLNVVVGLVVYQIAMWVFGLFFGGLQFG